MNKKEFIGYIEQIQNLYHKQLTQIEVEIWYDNLKFLTIERFNYILSEIYKTNKYMPTLADILQMHRQIPYTIKDEEENIKTFCNKCNNLGYVIFIKKISGINYKYAAVCDCGRRKKFVGSECNEPKNKSRYYIPTIQEIGLKVETSRPSNEEIVKSMNMLKESNLISENIKNIIRENFKKNTIIRR